MNYKTGPAQFVQTTAKEYALEKINLVFRKHAQCNGGISKRILSIISGD